MRRSVLLRKEKERDEGERSVVRKRKKLEKKRNKTNVIT
jgi:hypothetical protein